jgi:uncharacterized protein (PEP-CTERM system associated)
MATMAMATVRRIKSIPLVSVTALLFCYTLSYSTTGGEWQFQPNIFIDETYSDNTNLSANNKIASLVSQAGVTLSSHFSSKKLEFTFSSKSEYAMYSHDHEKDNDFHTLNSNFRLKLAPNGLVLIGSANISNQSSNTSRNDLADIISGDTVRVENYSSGLEYTIDNSDFKLNSRIQYQTTQSEDNVGEQEGYVANLLSTNGSTARHFFWDASAQFSDYTNRGRDGELFIGEIKIGLITNYKITPFLRYYDETNKGTLTNNSSSLESDSYGGGLRWLISPRLILDISYNTPTGTQLDIDGKEQEDYTAASIRWEPSQRTVLNIDYGKRFYGESYGLDFIHKNKRLTNTITYAEQVNAFTRNNFENILQGSYWCPQGEITDGSACFINDNENINFDDYQLINLSDFILVEDLDLSLNKQLNWSSVLTLPRTTFSLILSSSDRENLNTRVEDKNQSASFSINRKISGNSNIQLRLEYNKNQYLLDEEGERQDIYRRYSLEYDKSLNSNLTFSLGLSHLNRNSSTQSLSYEEDRVYLKVNKGF